MTQSPFNESSLLELLELARIGEAKARELYSQATAIAEKYSHRSEDLQATTQKTSSTRANGEPKPATPEGKISQ